MELRPKMDDEGETKEVEDVEIYMIRRSPVMISNQIYPGFPRGRSKS
jgi:hypothetical protein